MISSKPYLIPALYDWIVDSGCKPYILVDARVEGCIVPKECVRDGQVVLNISAAALTDWYLDHEGISFKTRFSGVLKSIYVPMDAVMAIYAKETGHGMSFVDSTDSSDDVPRILGMDSQDASEPSPQPTKNKKPNLKIVE